MGKNIALVGNSRAVLGKTFDVDRHEIVIRMNGAWNLPQEMKSSVGEKLDLLCISGHKKEIDDIVKKVPLVVWMSPKNREFLSKDTKQALCFYPLEWWQELYDTIGSRPSTGCMTVDIIKRTIGEGHLTLYGFDFFENVSWHKRYTLMERIKILLGKEIYINPHDGQKEALFIRNCLPEMQLNIVKP
jgi:hypothetical protein